MNVVYNPAERPERQHELNKIPPSPTVSHPGIRQTIEAYEKARAYELARRQDFDQAEIELPAAQYRDEQALAAAKSAKNADPGPVEEEKQLSLIRECRRQHGAAKILLAEAVTNVGQAFAQHGDEWRADLERERDELRGAASKALDSFEQVWAKLEVNSSARAVARGGPAQSPALFTASFRAPRVRDGNVVEVADVLAGLRSLAKPEAPNTQAVENLAPGVEPTRHQPLRAPYASSGGSTQTLGRRVPEERVREWQERDEAEARARGAALTPDRRAERQARGDARKSSREAEREAVADEIEAVA